MSRTQRLYYAVLRLLLGVPLVGRLAISLHITATTRRTFAARTGAGDSVDPLAHAEARFGAIFRRVWAQTTAAPDRAAVLVVYEPRFRRIIGEILKRDVDVFILGRGLFDYLFQKHLSVYLNKHKRAFGEYALNAYERYPAERARYARECTRVAHVLKTTYSIDTIVLPKYNDDYTLQMLQAFYDTGWSTVVYDREGTVTKKRLELIPPVVARMAVDCGTVVTYNETHKDFFERVFELSPVRKPEILVIGNPASDDWFQRGGELPSTTESASGRQILYFAFGEFSYVFDEAYLKGKDEVWRRLLTEIHEALFDFLAAHPDQRLLYKRGAKGNRDYWEGSERLLGLPNARLMPDTANANHLIAHCDVVVAFQTTALIDAMHTDKLLIFCGWGDRYEELKDGLLDFEQFAREGAILHARSPEELRRMLATDARDVVIDLAARKRIRESFTTNPDGTVAKRFADWVVSNMSLPAPGTGRPNAANRSSRALAHKQ